MKKKVNGHIVEIGNMDTIEKGFEGLAMACSVSSGLKDTLSEDSEEVINQYVDAYETMYRALPFPLYAVENNLKYAAIGEFIKDKVRRPDEIWVENGLNVYLGEGRALKFMGRTWAIVQAAKAKPDNTSIEAFRAETGYREFEWALSQLIAGKKLDEYYKKFMPGFVQACEEEPMVLKWELSRLLEFGSVPAKAEMPWDRLVDTKSGWEYSLDIYAEGTKKVAGDKMVMDFTKENPRLIEKSRNEARYGFDILEKRTITVDDISKPASVRKVTSNLDGMAALFQIVVGQASLNQNGEPPKYRGVIESGALVFEVNGTVYRCPAARYQKPVKVCSGYEIYSYENGCVYLKTDKKLSSGVVKSSIYAYRIQDEAVLLCKIEYK